MVVPSATELPSQSKDSIPSVVPHGQIELGADFDHIPTRDLTPESQVHRDKEGNDTSPSTSYSTEVKDSEYSILESEFAHKLNLFTPPQYSFNNTIKDVKFGKTDKTRQTTSDLVKKIATVKDIIEFDRKGSRLGKRKVDLTGEVLEIKIEIHDIPQMSDQAKKTHLLNLLHSDLPFIHDLPIKHQLVMSALRYWVIHAQVKPAHLAALLVHYVGEKSDEGKFFQISLEAVHGFSQWQNIAWFPTDPLFVCRWLFANLQTLFCRCSLHDTSCNVMRKIASIFPQFLLLEIYISCIYFCGSQESRLHH